MSQSDFVSRGQALVAAGQFQEAVKVCRLGLLGRPTTVEGRVVLGQALLALKRFDEVLAEMRVALELDHSSIPAQALKAEAFLRKGDTQAAIEALHQARQVAPGDPRIMQLLGEAEHGIKPSANPSVGFVGSGDTKHYPDHPSGEGETSDSSESYTKPTSIAGTMLPKRKTVDKLAAKDPTPSPDMLAVGDKSGTVEVDPDAEGIEVEEDLDFDDLAAPPSATGKPPQQIGGERGSVKSTRPAGKKALPRPNSDAAEIETVAVRKLPPPGSSSAVRNAIQMPSGPLGLDVPPPRSKPLSAAPPVGLPGVTQRGPVASALPTVTAMPAPVPPPLSPSPSQIANAVRPTIAIAAAVPPPLSPSPTPSQANSPNWARATMLAPPPAPPPPPADARVARDRDPNVRAANEPTARPSELDLALESASRAESGALVNDPEPSEGRAVRKRSKLTIALWIVIGGAVIGGGVFAGFQIRAMRLQKQIIAARDHATDLAKADTWTGWTAARDSLAGIVQASGTSANLAVLARARALIAYEFGDGLADAKAATDALAGQGGLDGDLAAAYLALAQSDAKAAKTAADAALAAAPQDAAAFYVAGQAALLGGDATTAVKDAKDAFDKEARPLYGVGLARVYAATGDWGESLAALKRALAGSPDQPAAVIERAMVMVASGQIAGESAIELHAQLEKVISEGHKAVAEQPRGVSPAQIAFAGLALALVDFARNDVHAASTEITAALAVGLDDQRFAEAFIETVFALGDLSLAQKGAERALSNWAGSRRARIVLAEISLAQGRAGDALDLFIKQPEIADQPLGHTIRGQAYLALGDFDRARTDFDAALKALPKFEPALVGRAWLDLATGAVDDARKRIEHAYPATGATLALTTVYAAILRRSGERDKAKSLLEKVVAGPATADTGRAQLELARADRDLGDFKSARAAYSAATATGNFEARLENGLLMIEDRDPNGGRDTLDELLKQAGDHPPPQLVLETARARMLVGDHAGAAQLLDLADKLPGVVKWQLLRERGRLALRRGDFAGAVTTLTGALDGCGDDAETFMLAADAAGADDKTGLADKIKKLVVDRLKTRPEASIVSGKLLLAAGKDAEAEAAYRAAKENLKNEKAAARRIAQADFGLAVAAYNRQNDAAAKDELTLVLNDDPSIYDAYLFMADLLKDKKAAFEQAQQAVRYNPDYPRAWLVLGKLAAKNNDKHTLADAIGKLNALAPTGEELKELLALRH